MNEKVEQHQPPSKPCYSLLSLSIKIIINTQQQQKQQQQHPQIIRQFHQQRKKRTAENTIVLAVLTVLIFLSGIFVSGLCVCCSATTSTIASSSPLSSSSSRIFTTVSRIHYLPYNPFQQYHYYNKNKSINSSNTSKNNSKLCRNNNNSLSSTKKLDTRIFLHFQKHFQQPTIYFHHKNSNSNGNCDIKSRSRINDKDQSIVNNNPYKSTLTSTSTSTSKQQTAKTDFVKRISRGGGVGGGGDSNINSTELSTSAQTNNSGITNNSTTNDNSIMENNLITGTATTTGSSSTTIDKNGNNDCTVATTLTSTSATSSTSATATTSSTVLLPVLQRIRRTIFPIYGSNEVIKFLLLGTIKFFIILALTLTRDCKDTLVVTQSGAEAIAFLKIYGVLPVATLYIGWYSKLSDISPSKDVLFYITCIPFFIFFIIFDWFIYPNIDTLHPSIETVQRYVPLSIFGVGGTPVLINILSNWTSALFYIVAELYSSVSVGLLFWQYANDVVPVDQAKRFYPLFAQMSGIAPVVAGQYVVHYASSAPTFQQSLHRLTNAVTFAGIMICYFYRTSRIFLLRTEGTKEDDVTTTAATTTTMATNKKKKKPKMSMIESAKFLARSEYLRLIATLVVGYGLSINFTEILWKSLVKKQYPDPLQYQRYMGQFSSIVGISTCIVIFFGVHIIRILGWKIGAIATPTVMAIISVPFFACVLWPGASVDNSPTRLATAVLFGTLNSLLSKTAKYALFDPTTQMAYIPLDDDSKIKGKAAIDVLGSRIGKSGGSFIQQGLVLCFGGSILAASPAVCVLYYTVLFVWIHGANRLSRLFTTLTELQQNQKETEKETYSLQLNEVRQEQQALKSMDGKEAEIQATSPKIKKMQ